MKQNRWYPSIDMTSLIKADISQFKRVYSTCEKGELGLLYMMTPFRSRLMLVNQNEKTERQIAFDSGESISGISSTISTATNSDSESPYASGNGMNYAERSRDYVANEGLDTETNRMRDFFNSDSPYIETINLYTTAELGKDDKEGTFFGQQGTSQDSLLDKTRTLFKNKKINTVISGFHTRLGSNPAPVSDTDASTKFGMSHGRNLLTKKAETNGDADLINGYDNPYCRVWTHHHQYNRYCKLIRPFSTYTTNSDGTISDSQKADIKDTHTWYNFNNGIDYETKEQVKKGWKSADHAKLWENSVLNTASGMVNITPKYLGGGKNNIHTKQCMFSIENLAWQGYDPYSFKRALSWEQRGPMGGRIMWFPPYGIRFTETTNVNWNSHTFIGRGEDVYTYTNTNRTGTLEFMLVVDHPSVIDYVLHNKNNADKIKDTDFLRFFAGCDNGNGTKKPNGGDDGVGDGESLFNYATPTPLTDEYIQKTEKTTPEEEVPEETEEPEEEIPEAEEIKVTFAVFYPNNYSGYWDSGVSNDSSKANSKVDAIAYLLAGVGAQKNFNGSYDNSDDLELRFDGISSTPNTNIGVGYEMAGNGITDDSKTTNYIVGTTPLWQTLIQKKTNRKNYVATDKKWKYRIDGYYPSNGIASSADLYRNCYDQSLLETKNYSDSASFQMNSNADKGTKKLLGTIDENSDEIYCSLAEMAIAVTTSDADKQFIKKKASGVNEENVTKINELLYGEKAYEITSVECFGYSNSHGNNNSSTINTNRNEALANNRAITAAKWFIDNYNKTNGNSTDLTYTLKSVEASKAVDTKDLKDANGESSKLYRSAIVTVYFKRDATTTLAETDETYEDGSGNTVQDGYKRFVGFSQVEKNGKVYYVNDSSNDGKLWEYKNGELVWSSDTVTGLAKNTGGYEVSGVSYTDDDGSTENDYSNVYRYDQEYHFFKALQISDETTFNKLTKKLQYFVPAYHSMTPEGFNARLTFLQQCTRQGNTVGASDTNKQSANNMAFGRPPFCVLRLGDFYNQMIVIDNISINYDNQLDLNIEGIGVQPLIANVSISFKFIGGGDITGPIKRLQNAMSFNYYANASLYDNRADHVEYNWDEKESGAINHDMIDDDSYFYMTDMQK